jgi:hypothetical protein
MSKAEVPGGLRWVFFLDMPIFAHIIGEQTVLFEHLMRRNGWTRVLAAYAGILAVFF